MTIAVHWFRRDLRLRDNTGLFTAAAGHEGVVGIFVIDPRWFGNPEKTGAHQATFWLAALRELRAALAERGIPLVVRTSADPVAEVLGLARELKAEAVTYNKDYEPEQVAMDERLEREAAAMGIKTAAYKDAVVFEEQEILTGGGGIYSVFTPYKRAYLKRVTEGGAFMVRGLPRKSAAVKVAVGEIPEARALGYPAVEIDIAVGEAGGLKMLQKFLAGPVEEYRDKRDYPAVEGGSRLSAHLNAGTVSIRQALQGALEHAGMASKKKPAGKAMDGSELHTPRDSAEHFVSELIWREFYKMILFNFPETVSKPFQEAHAEIAWDDEPAYFEAWAAGRTGYPMVDAAMGQLNATGVMHNRLRMVAAMFLTKDLDTHWIKGERHFMKCLMDYDQACNVGGWQWSASTGTDAAPYFRIMNPVLQSARYDPEGAFIRKYVPALKKVPAKFIHAPWEMPSEVQRASGCEIGVDYPRPVVDHAVMKERAIAKFKGRR